MKSASTRPKLLGRRRCRDGCAGRRSADRGRDPRSWTSRPVALAQDRYGGLLGVSVPDAISCEPAHAHLAGLQPLGPHRRERLGDGRAALGDLDQVAVVRHRHDHGLGLAVGPDEHRPLPLHPLEGGGQPGAELAERQHFRRSHGTGAYPNAYAFGYASRQESLDRAQRLMPASTACWSIRSSSSAREGAASSQRGEAVVELRRRCWRRSAPR